MPSLVKCSRSFGQIRYSAAVPTKTIVNAMLILCLKCQTGPGHHGDDEYEYEIHHFEKFHDESRSLFPDPFMLWYVDKIDHQ